MLHARPRILLLTIGLLCLVGGILALRLQTPEDAWICENGVWVMHGNPAQEMPSTGCGMNTKERERAVEAYLRTHLSELSPTKAVLGGTFFPTLLYFPKEGEAIIEYEDGHIARTAHVTYAMESDGVRVASFVEFEDSFRQDGNLIKDNPGLPPGVWYLSFDSPGKAGNIVPIVLTSTYCTDIDGSLCTMEELTSGMRVRVLGTEEGKSVMVRRIEILAK